MRNMGAGRKKPAPRRAEMAKTKLDERMVVASAACLTAFRNTVGLETLTEDVAHEIAKYDDYEYATEFVYDVIGDNEQQIADLVKAIAPVLKKGVANVRRYVDCGRQDFPAK